MGQKDPHVFWAATSSTRDNDDASVRKVIVLRKELLSCYILYTYYIGR